ncbi:MAG: RsmF rRNA methyltransferase first C-terminal domain-containing protein, partial [Lachnospiraceae bacterium]|nr:RsmF rRNA methyltransferase first C-terminal domain-containing protein [Lachnospiraceae bacterium]
HGMKQEETGRLLKRLGITSREAVPWATDAYYYEEMVHPGKHPYHEMGLYYIQEPSAMSAAQLLSPRPGERVLDLCAAPGGKSTQLASMLGGAGLLVSNEIHPQRCRILSQNIERMGISNAIVTNEPCEKLSQHFPAFFHKVLVDAPCSGEGMFRKNPEAMEEWSAGQVQVCAQRQAGILDEAAKMLMPGGVMVYSTCTFSPEENECVIHDFLQLHGEFELMTVSAPYFDKGRPAWCGQDLRLEKTFRLFPHHLHGEGHYVAVLRKTGAAEALTDSPLPKKTDKKRNPGKEAGLDKLRMEAFMEFADRTLTKSMTDFLLSGQLLLFGDELNRVPTQTPPLAGVRTLRAGLHLGTFKKNRFEPSHALALFLGRDDVCNCVELGAGEAQTAAFFRGETLQSTDVCGQDRSGFCLVCVDGFSAGWGKRAGQQIKNHYPKGLRKSFE